MNRRGFLRSFATVPLVAAVVPDLVRTIILPPAGGWPQSEDYFARLAARRHAALCASMAQTWREALRPGLEQIWAEAYEAHRPEWEDFYRGPRIPGTS